MQEMNDKELAMFNILKNNKKCRDNNWEAVREYYRQIYNISLPELKNLETVWTVERLIRTLKSTYPSQLTDKEERQIKAEMVGKYREMALDENKPVLPPKQAVSEQGSLGLFGEPMWW